MTPASAVTGAGDVRFTDEDFKSLAQLAHAEFGLALAESKKPLVYSRIARRLRARNIEDFPSYMALLKSAGEAEERLELISALTTNVTSFFREKHHFDTLRKDLLPQLAQQPRIRIWSAGCSSGQEAFSIAMTLLDTLPEQTLRNARILATDIDPAMIRRANTAQYPTEDLTTIPSEFQPPYTQDSPGDPACFQLRDPVRRLVTFGELNLWRPGRFKARSMPSSAEMSRSISTTTRNDGSGPGSPRCSATEVSFSSVIPSASPAPRSTACGPPGSPPTSKQPRKPQPRRHRRQE